MTTIRGTIVKFAEILLETSFKSIYNLTMDNEIKYLKRDISDIKSKVDELKAGQARLEGHMEGMKELVKGMSELVKAADRKAEKTESRLWYIVIAVIIAGGIPSLITKLLG